MLTVVEEARQVYLYSTFHTLRQFKVLYLKHKKPEDTKQIKQKMTIYKYFFSRLLR